MFISYGRKGKKTQSAMPTAPLERRQGVKKNAENDKSEEVKKKTRTKALKEANENG